MKAPVRWRRLEPFTVAAALRAVVVLGITGWLGVQFADGLGVGVDRVRSRPGFGRWTRVLDEDEARDGQPHLVDVDGRQVLLVCRRGCLYAMANVCSHLGGPLDQGTIEDESVTCPWHASTFALATGLPECGPAVRTQPTYALRLRAAAVYLRERRRPTSGQEPALVTIDDSPQRSHFSSGWRRGGPCAAAR